MAQTWPLWRSRGCPWHIFENVEDHFNYYLLFVVIINIETLNKINIRNPNLTSLLCLVLYKLNCQHLLHSYKTNSAQSKTLTLQDSLFLNGRFLICWCPEFITTTPQSWGFSELFPNYNLQFFAKSPSPQKPQRNLKCSGGL